MKPRKPENEKRPERAPDPDIGGAEAALRRAAERASRRAAACGNDIAVFQDGKIVWVKPYGETRS